MGLMKQVFIRLSTIDTTEDKELTLMLTVFKITPLHGKQLNKEFHRNRFRGRCFLLRT
jgi:hypothetical protein